jgi:hypothetical protein
MNETEFSRQRQLDPASQGAAIEAPFTRPFEGYVYLKKEWVDQEDGIEKVTVNYTWSHLNLPADWNRTEQFVMMPEWGTVPLRRTWIVRLPTHLDAQDRYLFHYFFQVFGADQNERVSTAFTQMIVPHEFECIDHSGEVLFVRLHWSMGHWTYPQDTELEADGIEWGSECSVSNAPYRMNDRLFQSSRLLQMRRLPVPRRFRGLIWAPKGTEVKYCFHLLKHAPDGLESHWDNNFGKDYCITI